MSSQFFAAFSLILTLVWMNFYANVRENFNGVSEYQRELSRLKKEMQDQRLAQSLEREGFLEFRQHVAELMPSALEMKGDGQQGYPYRSLASVISRKEAELIRGTIAKTLFEKGKQFFRAKNYLKSNQVFKEIIQRYSYSPYVPESYFLLAEGHFQENDLEECVATIQFMVEQFPQNELTGFALIRLGRIYEMQSRKEEAVDIYKTVIRSYPQRDVASQAKASLRGLDL